MWRYRSAYPVKREGVTTSYGEGLTPLTRIEYKGHDVLVKQDSLLPTGSFKDRDFVGESMDFEMKPSIAEGIRIKRKENVNMKHPL